MKALVALLSALSVCVSYAATADVPQGDVMEVHSVEVYTGGCTASAQATSGGRSMLRVWSFDQGAYNGVDLRGLQIAALQTANDNLAAAETQPTSAVVYLPRIASDTQRAALLAWLKSANPEFARTDLVTKVTDLNYTQQKTRISLGVGDQIALKTRAIQKCDSGACGEALWYKPRTRMGDYTVVVNETSSVNEPALSLVWKDNSAKSVFLGRFGSDAAPQFHLASIE